MEKRRPDFSSKEITCLWSKLRKGNQDAFSELYPLFHKDLYFYGYKILGEASPVEDCLHDLFVDLWEKRKKLPPNPSVKFFLLGALKNKILMHMRRHKKQQDQHQEINLENYNFNLDLSFEMKLIREEENQETILKINQALNDLPARQGEIVYLRFYHKMPYEEIAQLLGITQKSAHNLFYKAINRLRNTLRHEEFTTLCLFFVHQL